ncbi:hypothetical protein L2E82_11130 [Cichorium intybus]|uniref:Uncharacterized protein n=1 Tax=Cichorium intybus TaxID=13427 RepID=A0ACB9GCG2_CICIN|nr:hypothetical protein L2E82_11130 [Cichorium intybus]
MKRTTSLQVFMSRRMESCHLSRGSQLLLIRLIIAAVFLNLDELTKDTTHQFASVMFERQMENVFLKQINGAYSP